jgi:hypothetical protein
MKTFTRALLCFLLPAALAVAQAKPKAGATPKKSRAPKVTAAAPQKACETCIRAEEAFLASDAMRGRGSGTHDEELAANYIGSELLRYGIVPAGDNGGFVQMASMNARQVTAPPVLNFTVNGAATQWMHGKEIIAYALAAADVSGPLQKLASLGDIAQVKAGAIVLAPSGTTLQNAGGIVKAGAAAVLLPASPRALANWAELGSRVLELGGEIGASTTVLLSQPAQTTLAETPEGATITIHADAAPGETKHTWNAVGILRGSNPQLSQQAVLLTAHLDHLGVGPPVNGDDIYNGADDDASGCVAVLELARVLGSGAAPKRTVVFAFFGSEEGGGYGSRWFLEHAPVPLENIVANLEFEMLGRPDPKYRPDELWLTGWERSNLGPTLAQHGARLVADARPEQNFFQRSDNIVLAKRGIVAQTVSSFGLHPDYHRPSDDLQHLDFAHMTRAIGSMLAPVEWLVNSDFVPQWLPGKKP